MAKIVAIHGIAQEYKAPAVLRSEWLPSLRGGLEIAGGPALADNDVAFPFYGNLFRPKAEAGEPEDKAGEVPFYTADDIEPGMEEELLLEWWKEAARIDPNVQGPETEGKAGLLSKIGFPALRALSNSKFFTGLTDRAMVFFLKQVYAYFHADAVRAEIQRRVAASVSADTRLLIGHSLGSVAAYEALCAHSDWPVRALVTLGSPLAIKNLIFHRLRPEPSHGVGAWPGPVKHWVNVADDGDIVALERELRPFFGEPLQDISIDNGARPHDVSPYLTAQQTGRAIAEALIASDVA